LSSADLPDSGEDIDLTLRHVSRQFPEDFARAILPSGMKVSSAAWLDTQATSRQRRLDRVLEVVANGKRRLEHTEWQLEWQGNVPLRLFEYHVLLALAAASESTDGKRPPPIRSTLVLLSGREKPWPAQGEYRTSPPGEPFTGVAFRIDAVYQRTVAELEARKSPLWLMFAPLAVDADAAAMRRVVATLRKGRKARAFEELAVALTVMADADKRRRGLRNAILPLLKEELVMASWVYEQGKAAGAALGEALGEARGKALGEANALLRVIEARGLSVPGEARARILSCTDTAQLDAWLDRALVAARVEEILDGH
jgi:hypothetical protein